MLFALRSSVVSPLLPIYPNLHLRPELMQYECFDAFFDGFESADAVDEFQSRCNVDCDEEDYTHYT